MKKLGLLFAGGAVCSLMGCSSLLNATRVDGIAGLATGKPTISLEQVPTLFGEPPLSEMIGLEDDELTEEERRERRCEAINLELNGLSAALGGEAVEMIVDMDGPSATDRIMSYGKNMAVETVKGYVQPFIQTKRALFNDDEKERRAEEAEDRGVIRRAYLTGLAAGIPCNRNLAGEETGLTVEDLGVILPGEETPPAESETEEAPET